MSIFLKYPIFVNLKWGWNKRTFINKVLRSLFFNKKFLIVNTAETVRIIIYIYHQHKLPYKIHLILTATARETLMLMLFRHGEIYLETSLIFALSKYDYCAKIDSKSYLNVVLFENASIWILFRIRAKISHILYL
jgi:hypothetical protein